MVLRGRRVTGGYEVELVLRTASQHAIDTPLYGQLYSGSRLLGEITAVVNRDGVAALCRRTLQLGLPAAHSDSLHIGNHIEDLPTTEGTEMKRARD